MTDAQIRAVKEALEIIKGCANNIMDCCTKDVAPDDPEAIIAYEADSFPDWLPLNFCKKFDEIWDLSNQIKQEAKILSKEIE